MQEFLHDQAFCHEITAHRVRILINRPVFNNFITKSHS